MKMKEDELIQREMAVQQREKCLNEREKHLNQLTEALYYKRQQQHFGGPDLYHSQEEK